MGIEPESEAEQQRPGPFQVIGWLGGLAVAVGYLLEAIRQRGDCDAGDKLPDTLAISVVLIVLVGGLSGLVGVAGTLVTARQRGWSTAMTVRAALPAVISLAGALAILVVAGREPSSWFQYCAT